MSQQLKVGQVWISRDGREVTIMKCSGGAYPFDGDNGKSYGNDGSAYSSSIPSDHDLIELIRDVPGSDGWITWNGGECPVSGDTVVEVKLRDGHICTEYTPAWLRWGHEEIRSDIVAYRVVKQPAKSEQPTPDDAAFLTTATGVLAAARNHMIERATSYDKPEGERSMGSTVAAFNAITGRDLSEPEGWLLVQILKDVRLFQRDGYHADSAEDCVAYAALKAEAKAREAAK